MAKSVKTGRRQRSTRNKTSRDVQAFADRIFLSRNPAKEFQGIMERLDAGLEAEETKFFQHNSKVRQRENVINWSASL